MRKIISIVILVSLLLMGFQMVFIYGECEDEKIRNNQNHGEIRGNTLYVGLDQPYSAIQSAIDAANPGDTIRVYSGTYNENIRINKTISLIGNGSGKTIIKGNGLNGDVIRITANWVNISNFEIIDSGTKDFFPDIDAGIELDNVNNVTISENDCNNNLYGIFLSYSENNFIKNNSCNNNLLDGIHLYFSNNNNIIDNNCSNNNNGIYSHANHNISVFTTQGGSGYVYATGSKCNSNSVYYEWLYTADNRRGWVKINLSSVPDNVIIKRVTFNGYVSYNKSVNWLGVRLLKDDPTTSSGSTVWGQAGNGTRLGGFNGSIGWKKVDLGLAGVTAVQNALDNDWIGLGIDYEAPLNFYQNYGNIDNQKSTPIFLEIDYHNSTLVNKNRFQNNTCFKNNEKGIYIGFSNNDIITNNDCNLNNNGIFLQSATKTMIRNNVCRSNSLYGTQIKSSKNSDIYHNDFINNSIQATDNGLNRWNLTYQIGGNYWSNWMSPDNFSGQNQDIPGSDGYVDNPFIISGPVKARDYFPLTSPINIPPPKKNQPPGD